MWWLGDPPKYRGVLHCLAIRLFAAVGVEDVTDPARQTPRNGRERNPCVGHDAGDDIRNRLIPSTLDLILRMIRAMT